jgi:hypothetical protein
MLQPRKHTTIILVEKLEILNKLENGDKLVNEFGVGRAIIYYIRKKHDYFFSKITKVG